MIEIDIHIKHHFTPYLYAKEMTLPAGHYAVSHKHNYNHIGALFSGRALVEVDGVIAEYSSPSFVLIKAGLEHKITALENVRWFCVHETEETNADEIDRVAIMGD